MHLVYCHLWLWLDHVLIHYIITLAAFNYMFCIVQIVFVNGVALLKRETFNGTCGLVFSNRRRSSSIGCIA
jgi:hypothetical protein